MNIADLAQSAVDLAWAECGDVLTACSIKKDNATYEPESGEVNPLATSVSLDVIFRDIRFYGAGVPPLAEKMALLRVSDLAAFIVTTEDRVVETDSARVWKIHRVDPEPSGTVLRLYVSRIGSS